MRCRNTARGSLWHVFFLHFEISAFDQAADMGSQFFSLIFYHFRPGKWALELDDDSAFRIPGQMVLEYGGRVENHHGTTGTPPFSAILKLPSWEGRMVSFTRCGVPPENAEGVPPFDLFHAFQNCLQPSLILSCQKEAVDCLHPVVQQYPPEHLFLRHIHR